MLFMLVAPYLVELLLTAAVLTGQGICVAAMLYALAALCFAELLFTIAARWRRPLGRCCALQVGRLGGAAARLRDARWHGHLVLAVAVLPGQGI